MSKTAWIFPGQGSQTVGMGRNLAQKYPQVANLYAQADAVLGYALSSLCFEGPEAELTRTDNAQPALLLTSLAHLHVLKNHFAELLDEPPLFVAGHSLGEYTALVANGVLGFEDALLLVRKRGQLMNEIGQSGMVAVLGVDEALLEQLADQTGVEIANYNSPGQIALSGTLEALAKFSQVAKEVGVKRVMPLSVSAGFHSSLMRPVADKLALLIQKTTFQPASFPLISNVTGQPLDDPQAIQQELISQTYKAVRWVESVQTMASHGVSRFVEIGAGKILSGLVKRIDKNAELVNSEDILK